MNYFVSARKYEGTAVLQIEGGGNQVRFPLTKKGCIQAGKYMLEEDQLSWSCSSSVDYPREVKPSFRHDIRELMQEGYTKAIPPLVVQEKRVGDYEIRGNQFIAIAINVTNPKDAHYFDIDPDVNNDAFIRACGWAFEG